MVTGGRRPLPSTDGAEKDKAASYPLLPSHQSGDSFSPLDVVGFCFVFFSFCHGCAKFISDII